MRGAVFTVVFGVVAFALVMLGVGLGLGQGVRHVVLARPWWLLLGALPFVAVAIRWAFAPRPATMRFTRRRPLERMGPGLAAYLGDLPDGLRFAAALCMVVALARPQSTRETDRVHHEGIDIAVALDLSESMNTTDLLPNRLEAAKAVIDGFIVRRPHDRIALVAFGLTPSTVSPLTMDHDVLRALVRRLRLGIMDGSRTAIGGGLGMALNRLDESEAESKVIVLLTDGVHNAPGIDPDSAANEAAKRGVVVYTILMGRHEGLLGQIDPKQLERIAAVTGGYAYTAQDVEALETSFQDLLDKLERSSIEGDQIRAELFFWFLWPALGLLLLEVVLRNTRLRRFP